VAGRQENWEGLWRRGSSALVWDPNRPPGPGQQPLLTAEYQTVYGANLAKRNAGALFGPAGVCGLGGMPRIMTLYVAMEIVIKPNVTYMLLESTNPIRRIYTDGRDRPQTVNPQSVGYSIGRWLDTGGGALTIRWRSRRARRLRLFDTLAFHCTKIMRRSSRNGFISTSPIPTSCATRSQPSITP
jgi:hypothetical protein